MKRWYMSLPKYSKDVTIEGSNKCYRTMIRLLAQNIGSHELLFEKFPKIFGFKSFKKFVAGSVDAAKQYYDNITSHNISIPHQRWFYRFFPPQHH